MENFVLLSTTKVQWSYEKSWRLYIKNFNFSLFFLLESGCYHIHFFVNQFCFDPSISSVAGCISEGTFVCWEWRLCCWAKLILPRLHRARVETRIVLCSFVLRHLFLFSFFGVFRHQFWILFFHDFFWIMFLKLNVLSTCFIYDFICKSLFLEFVKHPEIFGRNLFSKFQIFNVENIWKSFACILRMHNK